ncbi:MAG: glycosyltransferase family 2 protein [Calditrichia bacterium]
MKTNKMLSIDKYHCGIIIPVYNSADHIAELLQKIGEVQNRQRRWVFNILIVDDGSEPELPACKQSGLIVEQIRHNSNMGKGAALQSGFRYFLDNEQIEPIVTMDGDLQHPPEYLPHFLKKFETENSQVVVGYRQRNPKVMPLHRIVSNTLTSLIISGMTGQMVRDSQCGYRLYSRTVLERMTFGENRFHLESEMLIRCGWLRIPIDFTPIPTIYNSAPSAINNLADTWDFISLIIRMTARRLTGHV